MSSGFDYQSLMRQGMLDLIKNILRKTRDEGLVAEQHFFINFSTSSNEVVMSQRLKDQYPDEMTIIVKNWYADLEVTEDHFSITLNFGNVPENMRIPYQAINSFSDPSVNFTIRPKALAPIDDLVKFDEGVKGMDQMVEAIEDSNKIDRSSEKKRAEIINLETFRKK